MDQYIGRLLDNRYEILEVIGTGGMAVVYKARCHRLNRLVAIKILKDEFARDEEFRRRFSDEGEAVAMLSHPNIVQVYDVSSNENANYMVMELVDGISLKQYMERKGVLNWKETLHFAMQIAKGLEHAHSRGIVHRDIKPHNVMVLKNGSVKVMDFGIARVMSKSNTLTKEALGSVHYISPEQAKGGRVDNRSDLYSLSVVMYEMMTGRPPYDGESPVAVAIQHINGGAQMPSVFNPNIPTGMEQIIMKGMALEPNDRYCSATEMLHDMEEFRKNPMIVFPWSVHSRVSDTTQPIMMNAAPVRPSTTAERVAQSRATGSLGRNSGQIRRPDPAPVRPNAAVSRNTASHAAFGNTAQHRPADRANSRTEAEYVRNVQQRRKTRREIEQEERRSRMTTVAIVSCSVIAIIAIIIFLVALMTGELFKTELVTVPNFLGQIYYSGMSYDDLIIKAEHSYNSEYAKGVIFAQNPSGGTELVKGAQIKVSVSLGEEPEVKRMEDLRGLKQEDAISWLKGQGMNPLPYTEFSDDYEEGEIIRTEPSYGEVLTDGQTVKLYVSSGPLVKTAQMPNLIGATLDDAIARLDKLGFKNYYYDYVENEAPRGEIVKQSVAKYTEVDITTRIDLKVSKGPTETSAPVTQMPTESSAPETTEESTTLPPTEETTQPPTETEPEERTITKTFSIPDRETAYSVTLYQKGQIIRESTQIMPGTSTYSVELTGSGVQTYEIWIDGAYYNSYEVVFN